MKACSVDLRERTVAAVVVESMSQMAAARRFGLDRSSVGRFVRAYQAGETLKARQSSGRPRRLRLAEHRAAFAGEPGGRTRPGTGSAGRAPRAR